MGMALRIRFLLLQALAKRIVNHRLFSFFPHSTQIAITSFHSSLDLPGRLLLFALLVSSQLHTHYLPAMNSRLFFASTAVVGTLHVDERTVQNRAAPL